MKDDNRQAGWNNYTRCCRQRYYVRNVDATATKARRFVSADSDERFSCDCEEKR